MVFGYRVWVKSGHKDLKDVFLSVLNIGNIDQVVVMVLEKFVLDWGVSHQVLNQGGRIFQEFQTKLEGLVLLVEK